MMADRVSRYPIILAVLLVAVAPTLHRTDAFSPNQSSILATSTRASSTLLAATRNKKSSPKNTSKGRKGRPRSRLLKSGGLNKPRRDSATRIRKPRPLLTHYDANRSEDINQERLNGSIGCEHFEKCSGCVVDGNVATVDRIKAAQQFFSSTAVRRKRMDVIEEGLEWAYPDTGYGDGFYKLVVPSKLTGWRTQAKLVVSSKTSSWSKRGGCIFGLYLRGTHKVLPIPNCMVHHPSINRAVELLEKATDRVGTPAFSEETREGGLRFVQMQVDRATGKVSLTLVWNAANLKETHPSLTLLKNELIKLDKDLWHSIWCHCNDGLGNNIFHKSPKRWHQLTGHEFMREPMPVGNHGYFFFSPLTFRQGNLDGFDILAVDVAKNVPGGSKVCELYAGVGVLGLTSLAYHDLEGTPLQWIRCSDLNPANPRSFYRAVDSLPHHVTHFTASGSSGDSGDGMTLSDLAKLMESGQDPSLTSDEEGPKTSYTAASAADALRSGQALGANTLIVDPPRKGLEDEVMEELCKPFNPKQPYVESATLLSIPEDKINWANDVNTLIYVSCGFDALARDTDRLLTGPGGWMLESAAGYILFPGSDHVETLAVFKRK